MWKTTVEKGNYIERCLVSFKPIGGKSTAIANGWVDGYDEKFMNQNLKPSAYAEYPPVFSKNPKKWKSVHFGDDEPESGMWLLSILCKSGREYVTYQYYAPDKSVFERGKEVMGWQKPPKAYT